MFGSSALSSGLGLGLTAFGGFAANDDEPDRTPPSPAPARALPATNWPVQRKQGQRANFYLDDGDRKLAATWKERARINVAAILTANEIEKMNLPATPAAQARLIRFTGFGAGAGEVGSGSSSLAAKPPNAFTPRPSPDDKALLPNISRVKGSVLIESSL